MRSLPTPTLALASVALASLASLAGMTARADDPKSESRTISLFNGRDLTGWSIYVQHFDGSDPTRDTKGVFKVENGVIHISGQEFGGLTTDKEYENYRLTVEFKWGTKRWPPRENAVRDSGILLHCVGPAKVWTRSIECQIQEHDCGDFWMVDGTTIVVDGKVERQRKIKKLDAEKPTGEWNTVEVICDGDKITNIVNGVVVNSGSKASVTRGKILLQSEGAEVFYRKVELRPLEK